MLTAARLAMLPPIECCWPKRGDVAGSALHDYGDPVYRFA
ncbi:hypothetical protein Mnod_8363 (plasmid) [Methylobacterium nodulans ORS 2060]|uniref:Uncharacterized protein n=1 Tax=Methylobacterium nodulans (strain LMG 21967 / CNCM I-2342 / ORS 2060) TaxID=460265 RepID=B8IVQ7_METNO|nr:hypothetical protein Mnod_8363 [Methylobacterium nodulans ORS 2060]